MKTPSYLKTLTAIQDFYEQKGYYPSFTQLGTVIKMDRCSAYWHTLRLEKEGYLKRNERGSIISLTTPRHGKLNPPKAN